MNPFFDTKIEFLKGVGPKRGEILRSELGISTFGDLILHLPFRYEDRSKISQIAEIGQDLNSVQLKGRFRNVHEQGFGRKSRLQAEFWDKSGTIRINWFKGTKYVLQKIHPEKEYLLYGKPSLFNNEISISHPEFEPHIQKQENTPSLIPVYPSSEKLRKQFLDSRGISRLIDNLIAIIPQTIQDHLPTTIIESLKLIGKRDALISIHFPKSETSLHQAKRRLKFEELFFIQLRLLKDQKENRSKSKGRLLTNTKSLNEFYNDHIPFELTDAQKSVIKEIYQDLKSGHQMNRLLQGDVGSGKTMVAFLCSLMARDHNAQTCFMAPTEILAAQHFNSLTEYGLDIGLRIAKLTGSTKSAERKETLALLKSGEIDLIVGTHALIEDRVKFNDLGLCIIDEQHRFGVAQRARLWQKTNGIFPHVLVMTATPIPRTLALTLYGDLDISTIDQLPPGRKPVITRHANDSSRLMVFKFLREEIKKGRQVYIVYPLIEESKKLDYKDLMDGYASISRSFSDVPISILHGQMANEAKEFEMRRFVSGETKIMVSTTVIEVGVNVPNASVMVIENAEKFGLAQLHQLRGRVGRGNEQSYCILVTGDKVSDDGKTRINTMVSTNDGFKIAEVDLQLRGPGDLSGTRQSGDLEFKIADLSTDSPILIEARKRASAILKEDPKLERSENNGLKIYLELGQPSKISWRMVG